MKRNPLFSLLLAFTLVVLAPSVKAQQAEFSLSVFNFPDTAVVDSTYDFQFLLTNISNSPFAGSLTINFIVDSMPLSGGTFATSQTSLNSQDTFSIPVNDFGFDPNNSQFRTGDNVVVVWPSANNLPAGDSLEILIHIPSPNGIAERNERNKYVRIYPSPVQDYVNLQFMDSKLGLKQVRMFDLQGRLVITSNKQNQIFMGNLNEGLYMVEIELLSGKRIVQKILKY